MILKRLFDVIASLLGLLLIWWVFPIVAFLIHLNPAKRNVLVLKNETCKKQEKRNVLKVSRTRQS